MMNCVFQLNFNLFIETASDANVEVVEISDSVIIKSCFVIYFYFISILGDGIVGKEEVNIDKENLANFKRTVKKPCIQTEPASSLKTLINNFNLMNAKRFESKFKSKFEFKTESEVNTKTNSEAISEVEAKSESSSPASNTSEAVSCCTPRKLPFFHCYRQDCSFKTVERGRLFSHVLRLCPFLSSPWICRFDNCSFASRDKSAIRKHIDLHWAMNVLISSEIKAEPNATVLNKIPTASEIPAPQPALTWTPQSNFSGIHLYTDSVMPPNCPKTDPERIFAYWKASKSSCQTDPSKKREKGVNYTSDPSRNHRGRYECHRVGCFFAVFHRFRLFKHARCRCPFLSKSWVCRVDGCDFKSSDGGLIQRHVEIHRPELVSCRHCAFTTLHNEDMKSHQSLMHKKRKKANGIDIRRRNKVLGRRKQKSN